MECDHRDNVFRFHTYLSDSSTFGFCFAGSHAVLERKAVSMPPAYLIKVSQGNTLLCASLGSAAVHERNELYLCIVAKGTK